MSEKISQKGRACCNASAQGDRVFVVGGRLGEPSLPSVRSACGFTLIEMLVVVTILGLLMTLVPRGVRKAREKAKRAEARVEMQSIETAVQAYFSEYGKLPVADGYHGGADLTFDLGGYGAAEAYSQEIISFLTAEDTTANLREIQFLEPQFSSDGSSATIGTFLDPWGYQYLIAVDADYDQTIIVLGDEVRARVAVVAVGLYELGGREDMDDVVSSWK